VRCKGRLWHLGNRYHLFDRHGGMNRSLSLLRTGLMADAMPISAGGALRGLRLPEDLSYFARYGLSELAMLAGLDMDGVTIA